MAADRVQTLGDTVEAGVAWLTPRARHHAGSGQETETSPNPYIKEAQSESFDPVNRIGDLLPMPTCVTCVLNSSI